MFNENELLDSVYEMMGFARWQVTFDEKGRTKELVFSDAFRNLLGYKDESDFPNNNEFYMSRVYKDDLDAHWEQIRAMEENNKPGKNFFAEFRMITKDGRTRWLRSITRKVFDEDGIPRMAIGVCIDITEQKQKESQEMLVRGLAQEYAFLWYVNTVDRHMQLIRNTISKESKEKLKDIIRSGEFEEIINGYIDNIVYHEDRQRLRHEFTLDNLIDKVKEGDIYHVNYKVVHSGQIHYRECCVARVNDSSGIIHFAIGVRNIDSIIETELEKQRELEEAKVAAEAANVAKSNFLFNMSHDIRTPLNAIIGFTDLAIKKTDDSRKVGEYLKNIHSSGEKLLDILNGVLEMARIESSNIDIHEEITDIQQLLESCYVMFDEAFRQKYLLYRVESNITNRFLYVDKTHFEEILLNIISNAVKYTPEGGQILIMANEYPGENEGECRLETIVEDNGIGMSEEFLKHAFDDFARERSEKTSNISGTGLGLPIVKRLVELMGGTINIESKLGKGTKVIINITFKIGSEIAHYSDQHADYDPAVFKGKSILLAEDNDLNAEIALEILQDEGFRVTRVADGIECVREINDNKPGTFDIVLMDIQMPNMNGYKATHEIRNLRDKKKSNIPIIAMTANAFKEDEQRAIAEGMNGHIGKPIDINKLMVLLETTIINKV